MAAWRWFQVSKPTAARGVLLAMALAAAGGPAPEYSPVPLTPQEAAAKAELKTLLQKELEAEVADRPTALQALFLPGQADAAAALAQARARADYLRQWARSRGLVWTAPGVDLRTPAVRFTGPDRIRFYAVVQEAYGYRYDGAPSGAVEHFGIGVRHYQITIERAQGHWYIRDDDFSNPAAAADVPPGAAVPGFPRAPAKGGAQQAVVYADRFCGAAPGCGNQGRYNPAYRNYNGEGGDCTNFISQALHAGGLPQTREWAYDPARAEGTRAWANADGLAEYLAASGVATAFAQGSYRQLVSAPPGQAPPVARLRPGDLISYRRRGRWVHTAMVVGYDRRGVPVTDAHSNDRYHVPWDFGWDNQTRYTFWHIQYPARPAVRQATAVTATLVRAVVPACAGFVAR